VTDTEPTDEAAEIQFRSDVTVELVKASASDADVFFAARVSTKGEQSLEDVDADATRSRGLINFLMRDRHGCYDAQTEVLTSEGWKRWPEVTGHERFFTLSADDRIELQDPQRLIVNDYDGPMVRICKAQLDLLVTPDHRMLARRRRQAHNERWAMVPAADLTQASHRLRLGRGVWHADDDDDHMPAGRMALLGFFIGDGHLGRTGPPSFRLRKQRELNFFHTHAAAAGFPIKSAGDDRYYLVADEDFRLLAKKCYDDDRAKVVPPEVLTGSVEDLRELLAGLMNSDGSIGPTGKRTFSTTSRVLAGQLQEIALKTGAAALVHDHPFDRDPRHLGSKPRYRVTLYRPRNMLPKVGWTVEDRRREVRVEHYRGRVYCATVPNGTLYVRRNGKPVWCGNSPFEHNSMTFYVQAPIFVFRELLRHRIASYNEESGRYRQLRPVFYVPGPERKLVQEGKPGAYHFVEGTPEQHKITVEATRRSCEQAYAAYLEMLSAGVAREVARGVLPVATYSSLYVTLNARALMNFLSLRTKREDARFPSYPQREIEMVAEKMEAEWARLMPLTHAAFEAAGRVSP